MKNLASISLILLFACFISCQTQNNLPIPKSEFGQLPDGTVIDLYTMTNEEGMQVQIMTYGATIVSLKVADNMGQIKEVTLGFDTLDEYLEKSPFFGCIVGRYGNRIAQGTFSLEGQEYTLAQNNGVNHLHGGVQGFDKVVWQAVPKKDENGQSVTFSYTSADGEEGYPGNLSASVTYSLSNENSLKLDYVATTDKATVVNLTNHTYFNLKDAGVTDILDHTIKFNADYYTPVDETLIPTGEIAPVDGTPFDFREPHKIGERINADFEQIVNGGGYDHNMVLNGENGSLKLAATVFEPTTGRIMNVATTEPGCQFYSGNFLNGLTGRGGIVYNKRAGFCLETQHYPDSPNQSNFPSVVLRPGEKYQSTTIYKFSLKWVEMEQ